ncbi:MAG TPA: MMPL family transporter [Thermoleophilaceae bacterium]
MERLAAGVRRWRWAVLAAWLVLVVVAAPLAARQSEDTVAGGNRVPGSESEQVREALARDFDERAQLAVVLAPKPGSKAADRVQAVDALLRSIQDVPEATLPGSTRGRARAAAERGRTAILPVGVLASQDRESEVAKDIHDRLRGVDGAGRSVSSHVIGRGALDVAIQEEATTQLERAETIGLPIVLLILLTIFGSLAAAALPVVLGIAAVLITGAAIYLASQEFLVSVFATNSASLFGIALAVDYSMFILVRFREEIRAGRDRDAAISRALSTSGVAIVFSGLTVVVAIGAIAIVDNAGMRSMVGAILFTVITAVLLSAVLLPVLMRLLGNRLVQQRRLPLLSRRSAKPATGSRPSFWERWTRVVLGRPILFATAATLTLLVLALPMLSLDPGEHLVGQLPRDNDTRVGYDRAAAEQGPGATSPVQVVLQSERPQPVEREAVASARATIARDPEVAGVAPPKAAEGGRSVLLTATPRSDGSSPSTEELVRRLRSEFDEPVSPGVTAQVGGVTAYSIDFQDQIFGNLWKVAVLGLAFSFVLLTVLLRSLVLPLKAVILNLLTVGAAYGAVVAVFQWGWLDGFLGFKSEGSVNTFGLLPIMTGVFALSMDYEIFLMSRIREQYERTGDPSSAIAQGLAMSARPITGAAVIMVALFCVFASAGLTSVREFGLGLAVGIALDATVVRLVLVPSTMQLLGRRNWWLPRPLARVLDNRVFDEAKATTPLPDA